MERSIEVAPDVHLWVEEVGAAASPPLLLVMGANASGLTWPDALVDRLTDHHRVVRYHHRDTGRSTSTFDERPYALTDLAADAVAILDALGIERAHVVGMSMGGTLVQLLLLDHPDRLLTATLIGTSALWGGPPADLPDIDPRLLEIWGTMFDQRDPGAELAWRVEHWRVLHGDELTFDPEEYRQLEKRIIDHAGRHDSPAAHAQAEQSGLDRGAELGGVRTRTLVIDAPRDPIAGTAHARHLAASIPGSRLVTIPGMGHAIPNSVVDPLAAAILDHTQQ